MQVQSWGWEDPLKKVMASHSNILAQKIPWAEEPGGLQSMGLQRVRHDWSNLACMHACTCIPKTWIILLKNLEVN